MLKVVCVCDKEGTALDRLAKGVIPYHSNLDYKVIAVHPKRPDFEQLIAFEAAAFDADIIDFQYFRTAEMLLEKYPWLKDKKTVLTHNNPYSIGESNWDKYDHVTGNNREIYQNLRKVMHNPEKRLSHIPLATDPTFFKFNFDWVPNKRVLMVANRIEAKKGILPVAIACGELGLTFVLVGAISDRMYFESIRQTGHVEFHEQISDEDLLKEYYNSTILVCNSVDNFESGTLPVLEAMQCGTPVLTRKVGHVPDLLNDQNLTILEGQPEDVEGITSKLDEMLNDKKKLEEQRQAAWKTASTYNMERRAYSFQRLYRSLISDKETVSIIVPVYNKPETIRACLNAIAEQDYPNLELIVVDDANDPMYENDLRADGSISNKHIVADFATTVSFPVRFIESGNYDYGLARARNRGIIEATGDILVFCDQRQIMAPNAVSEFIKNLVPKTWLFGDKGGNKSNFVENFSCISRTEMIEAGMFNERCDKYGALSQELRGRFRAQGFQLTYCPSAKATPMGKSSNRNRKKQDIIASKNMLWKLGL